MFGAPPSRPTAQDSQGGPKASQPSSKRYEVGQAEGPTEGTREKSEFAYNYANKLWTHLQREKIKPPQWPRDPGEPQATWCHGDAQGWLQEIPHSCLCLTAEGRP